MSVHRPGALAGREERGSGTLSTVFGVMVFLTLMMFASHLLLNLWLMSAVDGVAHDAATDVATSGADDAALAQVQQQAITEARTALGAYGTRVRFEFEPDATGRAVTLHVVAPELSLLPSLAGDLVGESGLDRRITVVRELPSNDVP